MPDRQAGIGDDDAFEEDFDDDMLAGIFVVAMSEGVGHGPGVGGEFLALKLERATLLFLPLTASSMANLAFRR